MLEVLQFNKKWTGFLIAFVLSAVSLNVMFLKPASAACASGSIICHEEWKVVGKSSIANRQGAWRVCVGWGFAGKKAIVTCQIAQSHTNTVTTSVSGSVQVKIATLSATVGYDVSDTTSVSGSYQYPAPANTKGEILWAPVYINRYSVEQHRYDCIIEPKTSFEHCTKDSTTSSRYAYTERYGHPTFKGKVTDHR